jgi:GNAT superfamily N-acetyltransferase
LWEFSWRLWYPIMSTLQDFPRHEIPVFLAAQIRSYVRMQWPFLNPGNTELWNRIPQPIPPRHFVLTDGELLISHAAVNQRTLSHRGRDWSVAGLSTVFTYPDRRGAGCASQVLAAATKYILQSNADLAILFAGHPLENFYHHHGWLAAPNARILFGPTASPKLKADNLVMMLLISPAAQQKPEWFLTENLYVGVSTW